MIKVKITNIMSVMHGGTYRRETMRFCNTSNGMHSCLISTIFYWKMRNVFNIYDMYHQYGYNNVVSIFVGWFCGFNFTNNTKICIKIEPIAK